MVAVWTNIKAGEMGTDLIDIIGNKINEAWRLKRPFHTVVWVSMSLSPIRTRILVIKESCLTFKTMMGVW